MDCLWIILSRVYFVIICASRAVVADVTAPPPVPDQCPLLECHNWVTETAGGGGINVGLREMQCSMGDAKTDIPKDNDTYIPGCRQEYREGWQRIYFDKENFRHWFNIVPFNALEDIPSAIGNLVAVSECFEKPFRATKFLDDTTAVIQSPRYWAGSECGNFQLSFWYRLTSKPVVGPSSDLNRFFLEAKFQYTNEGVPPPSKIRTIWGTNEDYRDYHVDTWAKATVDIIIGKHRTPFIISFMAHHNDNCTTHVDRISLDTIVFEKAESCATLPPITSSTTRRRFTRTKPTTRHFTWTPKPPAEPERQIEHPPGSNKTPAIVGGFSAALVLLVALVVALFLSLNKRMGILQAEAGRRSSYGSSESAEGAIEMQRANVRKVSP